MIDPSDKVDEGWNQSPEPDSTATPPVAKEDREPEPSPEAPVEPIVIPPGPGNVSSTVLPTVKEASASEPPPPRPVAMSRLELINIAVSVVSCVCLIAVTTCCLTIAIRLVSSIPHDNADALARASQQLIETKASLNSDAKTIDRLEQAHKSLATAVENSLVRIEKAEEKLRTELGTANVTLKSRDESIEKAAKSVEMLSEQFKTLQPTLTSGVEQSVEDWLGKTYVRPLEGVGSRLGNIEGTIKGIQDRLRSSVDPQRVAIVLSVSPALKYNDCREDLRQTYIEGPFRWAYPGLEFSFRIRDGDQSHPIFDFTGVIENSAFKPREFSRDTRSRPAEINPADLFAAGGTGDRRCLLIVDEGADWQDDKPLAKGRETGLAIDAVVIGSKGDSEGVKRWRTICERSSGRMQFVEKKSPFDGDLRRAVSTLLNPNNPTPRNSNLNGKKP